MKKIVLIILVGLSLFGCATKKKTYEFKENVKFDSISYKKEVTIYPALKDTVYIASPCDSLTGKLKDFKETFSTQIGKIIVEGKKGALSASIDLKESSNTNIEKGKVSKEKDIQVKEVEVIKYKVDWRLYILLLISILANLYFISRLFKK